MVKEAKPIASQKDITKAASQLSGDDRATVAEANAEQIEILKNAIELRAGRGQRCASGEASLTFHEGLAVALDGVPARPPQDEKSNESHDGTTGLGH